MIEIWRTVTIDSCETLTMVSSAGNCRFMNRSNEFLNCVYKSSNGHNYGLIVFQDTAKRTLLPLEILVASAFLPIPNINGKIYVKHINGDTTDKYYCSICFEYSIDIENIQKNKDLNILGIDYSSSSLYVDSNGNKANYPKYYRSSQQRLRILQQKFSRQQKGSANREKTLNKIHILHEKISNQRKDFLHKLSTSITKKFSIICVEDINMQNMSQCLHLGTSTMDNGFGMFREMLSYKQDRIPYHELILAYKKFPSSKKCSKCGNIKSDLTLKDRIYKCNECGNVIDRDLNAAINLKQYAFDYINGLNKLCRK